MFSPIISDLVAEFSVTFQLNPRSHCWQARKYKKFITFIILIDLCFFVASTEPAWEGLPVFYFAEGFSSSIFLVEYVARLATVTESKRFQKYGPVTARLRYVVTVPALIDALSTFPFFIELCFNIDLPTTTYLRIFRLFRILKTEGFTRSFGTLYRVVYYNQEILSVVSMLCAVLIIVTGVILYYLRPRNDVANAADFSSIRATMVLTTLMLTGQGGPEGDLPWYTESIVLLTGIFSLAMFAIPASMFTWGFEAEAARLAARTVRGYESSSSSEGDAYMSDSSENTSDEEYKNIIRGEDNTDNKNGKEGVDSMQKMLATVLDAIQKSDRAEPSTAIRVELLEAKINEMNAKLDRLLSAGVDS